MLLNRISLKQKFLFSSIFLIIVGMGLSGAVSYHSLKGAIGELASNQIRQTADYAARQIAIWLDNVRLNMRGWSNDKIFQTAIQDSFFGKSARTVAAEILGTIKTDQTFSANPWPAPYIFPG